jgi:thiol:disulfide interchange protein DsbA
MQRRRFLALAGGLALAGAVRGDAPFAEIRPPLAVGTAGRIEVVELFWYECPHCYQLAPHLERWSSRLPADVLLQRVPVAFNDRWRIAAQLYYALESMGQAARLHRPLFEAIHRDGLRIVDARELAGWLAQQGVDPERVAAAQTSFTVAGRLARAQELVLAARVDSVPALLIHGRYTVSAGQAGSFRRFFEIADALIERARAAAR